MTIKPETLAKLTLQAQRLIKQHPATTMMAVDPSTMLKLLNSYQPTEKEHDQQS